MRLYFFKVIRFITARHPKLKNGFFKPRLIPKPTGLIYGYFLHYCSEWTQSSGLTAVLKAGNSNLEWTDKLEA